MIGIIGGTGLYAMDGLEAIESREVRTPFGPPSAPLVLGRLGENKVAFLPRHGLKHELLPSDVNYRANIHALKSVGVRRILGVSAVGSLAQEVAPGDLAIPTQYFDWTRGKREATFFGGGLTAHISTAQPACQDLANQVERAAKSKGSKIHSGQAYACVEGPRLGTRAESLFLKGAGCQLVGMTNVPEAFLAREAQLCYCTIAIATDYDCWLDDPNQHVTVDKVIALYMANLSRVKDIVREVVRSSSADCACSCRKSLEFAVLSKEESLTQEKQELLAFLRR